MKAFHYFDKGLADPNDFQLKMCIQQGYVPEACLLAGFVVLDLVKAGKDPCEGCQCDRVKCGGRTDIKKKDDNWFSDAMTIGLKGYWDD